MSIIAAIPAFNEEKTIASVIIQTQKFVDQVVVCDDGSNDMTKNIAESLGAHVILHNKNMGYGRALRSLFEFARNSDVSAMIILDADGQHDSNEIPKLIDPIIKGEADITTASRFIDISEKQEIPFYKKFGIKILSRLTQRTSNLRIKDVTCGFRAYNKKAINSIKISENGMGATTEILLKAVENNLKIIEIPSIVLYKNLNTSTHNPLYLGFDILTGILRFVSLKHPLSFYGVSGVMFILFGIVTG